ncbi:MAG: (Fe-S)-binding protein [Sutterellaceae bacterium]|nr:(Fe-S)-binding protein [Sutterellaceae bacterium]
MQEVFPVRPAFWNVPLWAEIGVYIVGLLAIGVCIAGIVHAVKLRRGQSVDAPVNPQEKNEDRFKRLIAEILWQKRIRQTVSGQMHFALFWGFVLLFLGTAIATIDWDVAHLVFGKRILAGNVYLVYKFVLDLAGLVSLLTIVWYSWRRFVKHDFKVESSSRFAVVLGSLAFIIVTGFLLEALRLAADKPEWASVSFVGYAIAQLFAGASEPFLRTLHIYVWVVHGLAALLFVASVPLTFYGHIFKTPTSIFWQKTAPMGAIAKIEDIEEQETFGISKFEQFSKLDRIRFDGCTECGRCRNECPAVKAGTPLDPKNFILSLQARMRNANTDKELIEGIVGKDALWSCTTCGACAKVCPAQIPIPDLVVSMRRHLALEQGDFPEGLATALENTSSVGNPWGMDPGSRLKWAADLDVPRAKPGEKYDVLYWVGCSASYDRRAQKIARAMVEIFHAAGIKFAVMSEERCHADFARRAGEEYLFQMAAAENIESINRYRFDEIVTACPHCFNTLKNEYPQFENATWPVTSHVQLIARLIKEGKISTEQADNASVTLHDACYLARYNKIGRDPREIMTALGKNMKETEKRGCNATCCGAGGAQIFMDRPARINVIRLKELKAAGGDEIVVSCPHCMTMINSAQAQDTKTEPTPVRDIAEVVASQLRQPEAQSNTAA